MSVEDPGDVSFNQIGGLGEQIRELREVSLSLSICRFKTSLSFPSFSSLLSITLQLVIFKLGKFITQDSFSAIVLTWNS